MRAPARSGSTVRPHVMAANCGSCSSRLPAKCWRVRDNLCTSPRGGLVICEDAGGEQFIRGLLPDGEMFALVRAPIQEGKPRPTEFAGSCFSPDGRVLFFNQQGSTRSYNAVHGATYALWGPWEKGGL